MKLFRWIIQRHRGQHGVHNPQSGFLIRIRRANKHINCRKLIVTGQSLRKYLSGDGTPAVG
ncbi:hypothetical protein SLEP1_g432 [Rubroshorea leprosula]|uniref:Uncharacterized protein n=1 Tax=Rubroshorea leprosula TaxID=152421 RepID=A0AAV5HF76_9ROSI|nr:hypothetical protein SLEP1_g432 [Rubroshorea leprosula]